jgi:hypothetical protein
MRLPGKDSQVKGAAAAWLGSHPDAIDAVIVGCAVGALIVLAVAAGAHRWVRAWWRHLRGQSEHLGGGDYGDDGGQRPNPEPPPNFPGPADADPLPPWNGWPGDAGGRAGEGPQVQGSLFGTMAHTGPIAKITGDTYELSGWHRAPLPRRTETVNLPPWEDADPVADISDGQIVVAGGAAGHHAPDGGTGLASPPAPAENAEPLPARVPAPVRAPWYGTLGDADPEPARPVRGGQDEAGEVASPAGPATSPAHPFDGAAEPYDLDAALLWMRAVLDAPFTGGRLIETWCLACSVGVRFDAGLCTCLTPHPAVAVVYPPELEMSA